MKRFICTILLFALLFSTACSVGSKHITDSLNSNSSGDGNNVIFSYPADAPSDESVAEKPESSYISTDNSVTSSEDTTSSSLDDSSSGSSTVPDDSSSSTVVPDDSSSAGSTPDNSSTADESSSIAPPANVWINDLRDQQDRDYHGYDTQTLDDYFDDALFVGDSVANGLKLYTNMYEKVFTDMVFHTGASYGYHNAVRAITANSVHPVYQGKQRTIWEMVSLTGAKKVFIEFGLNDFPCVYTSSVQRCIEKIVTNVKAVNPDAEIIILSAGYFTKSGERYHPDKNDFRTCERMRDYNQFVLEYCNSMGMDYIDVSNCFADDYGYLPKEISMDNYCHPKITEYTAWRDILYSYAANKLMGTYKNPERME